ncbi:MAG TPA: NAD(P)/FAD-dependent oxidoreductase [Burkholderiales bacterium]|nr:NAD(P)/FAD-dependent oxidoreductase [Burkholderiales bacterium]
MTSRKKVDALVIGGGPAGATVAMRLLAKGIRPLVVERERFPRYHVGESMTGECGFIVRELGLEARMAANGHPVKHGVCVFGAKGTSDWWVPVMQRTEDGVLHEQVTWQVRRSVFDAMLLDEALQRGADLVHGRAVAPIVSEDRSTVQGAWIRLANGPTLMIEAGITIDCSGQASFLASHRITGPKYLGAYDKQIAIFSQVANYARGSGGERMHQPGNTHIFYKKKYHWAWAIPIEDGITSIGVVVPAQYFRDCGETKDDFLRREMRELNKGLAERIPDPELVEPAHVIPNYSFQVSKFAGPGYICVGDSHRFIDPIFSFGLFISMKEAGLAADAIASYLDGKGRDSADPFHDHMVGVETGSDILEDVLDTFWENPFAFSVFVHGKYRDPLIDVFAGRIYDRMPNKGRDEAIAAFRRLLKRERSYRESALFSVPIGSRFHPERAPLWNSELDCAEATERWMRDTE